jgi:hypothetical protein
VFVGVAQVGKLVAADECRAAKSNANAIAAQSWIVTGLRKALEGARSAGTEVNRDGRNRGHNTCQDARGSRHTWTDRPCSSLSTPTPTPLALRRPAAGHPSSGSCYKSKLWTQTCNDLGISVKKTRPYRPQTNGKIERFHAPSRTGGYSAGFTPPSQLDGKPCHDAHHYNHHRPHTAIGKVPPISRLTNLPGQYS